MLDAQKHLKFVQRDMEVYDSAGAKVGKVGYVHPGADEYIADWHITSSEDNASAFPPAALDELPDDSPEEVSERLLQLGFIKIKTGLLASDCYALPEHIAQVQAEEVHLSVEKDALPTF